MNKPVRQTLFWLPRILGILMILFLAMFSLDVLGMGGNLWQTLGGLLVHNLPALILLVLLILAWRWEWVGAAAFIGFGLGYLAFVRGFDWTVYLIIAGPTILIGGLFLVGWILRRQIRAR